MCRLCRQCAGDTAPFANTNLLLLLLLLLLLPVPSIVVGIAPLSEMAAVDGEDEQPLETENGDTSGVASVAGASAGGAGATAAGGGGADADDAGKSRALRRPRLKSQRSLGRETEPREERAGKESPKQQQQQHGRGTVHKHTLKVLGRSHAR